MRPKQRQQIRLFLGEWIYAAVLRANNVIICGMNRSGWIDCKADKKYHTDWRATVCMIVKN